MSTANRSKVGLALGGGAVRGLAHVGVLDVLIEAGIRIDCVAGASAGSLIGALFCSGMSLQRLHGLSGATGWWHFARLVLSPQGFLSFIKLRHWIVKQIGDLDFKDLPIPFTAIATDMLTGEEVQINSGRVAPAVQASCSIPGLVTPVEIDGRLLVDGSLVNTVPVSAVRRMGADYVIGVDILTFKLRRWLGPLGYGIAAIEIMAEQAGCGMAQADCLISPDLAGRTYMRFSKRSELEQLGRVATFSRLEEIRAALGSLELHESLIAER